MVHGPSIGDVGGPTSLIRIQRRRILTIRTVLPSGIPTSSGLTQNATVRSSVHVKSLTTPS